MNVLRSIGAVLVGFIIVAVLSVATDYVVESGGLFPKPGQGEFVSWMAFIALVYRSIFTVIGGFVTAFLAPNNKMRHVHILAILGTLGALAGLIGTWGQDLGPMWYPISLVVFGYPCVWLGGKLFEMKKKK